MHISISTPCHEDWNTMTPNEQGRHCMKCATTVIDFTSMTDEQVQRYLIDKKDANVCGRFYDEQLHRIRIELPADIFELSLPWWKQFLVASLIVFSTTLFSCEVTQPAPATRYNMRALRPHEMLRPVIKDTTVQPDVRKDSTDITAMMGMIALPDTVKPVRKPERRGKVYVGPKKKD